MNGAQDSARNGLPPGPRPDWIMSRERGSTFMLRLMSFLSLRLGRPAGRVVLHAIAAYFVVFAPRARAHMRAYLRRALGREPGAADLYRLMLSFATTIHDRVYLLRERFDLLDITLAGEQLVADRDARGEGAFLMGAHFGSFEVTRALGRSRPGVRVAMAMFEQNARKLNAVLEALNPQLAIDIIPLGTLDSMLQIRARLDAGIFVGVLGDRSFGADGYECVDFLGAPAWFPTSAMRAAALLHRPVIFMAGLYRGGNRYDVHFELLADFAATPPGGRDAAVRAVLEKYVAALERHCRAAPYNWFNFYDFWG
jgi:predicted LPLAT superfamily acyltransferase